MEKSEGKPSLHLQMPPGPQSRGPQSQMPGCVESFESLFGLSLRSRGEVLLNCPISGDRAESELSCKEGREGPGGWSTGGWGGAGRGRGKDYGPIRTGGGRLPSWWMLLSGAAESRENLSREASRVPFPSLSPALVAEPRGGSLGEPGRRRRW